MLLTVSSAKVLLAVALCQATVLALPDDPRLQAVRPRLEALVGETAGAGLPAELLVSKVREGLAKGVPAERIAAAAGRLAEGLHAARGFVRERHPGATPPAELVRALAEARLAGLELAAAEPLVRGRPPSADTARAVEVLTDLSLRGYPGARVSDLVKEVWTREPAAVRKLPTSLEILRREQALSHAETVDLLARGLQGGGSLEAATARAAAERRGGGNGKGKGPAGADDGAGPGRDGFVPPGQLKKQSGSKGRPSTPPGRGNAPGKMK